MTSHHGFVNTGEESLNEKEAPARGDLYISLALTKISGTRRCRRHSGLSQGHAL